MKPSFSDPLANPLDTFEQGYLPEGLSVGLNPDGQRRYSEVPTPGSDNNHQLLGWVQAPLIPNDGYYPDGLQIQMPPLEDITLRYTLDGSSPNLQSPHISRQTENHQHDTLASQSIFRCPHFRNRAAGLVSGAGTA